MPSDSAIAEVAFDAQAVRADFPILGEIVNGLPLVWLDSAATTQKPAVVLERLDHFYRHENSNIHRGAHELASRATDAYEQARTTAADFLGAGGREEIVFVRGTTEAINVVAHAWGRPHLGPGDEVLITWLEHHANIVPWQQLCQATGARLRVAPIQVERLERDIDALNADLEPLRSFVLPGGTGAAAVLHQARAVCRRAARRIVALAATPGEAVGAPALSYINRLADYLFVAARYANDSGRGDVLWAPGAGQSEK